MRINPFKTEDIEGFKVSFFLEEEQRVLYDFSSGEIWVFVKDEKDIDYARKCVEDYAPILEKEKSRIS